MRASLQECSSTPSKVVLSKDRCIDKETVAWEDAFAIGDGAWSNRGSLFFALTVIILRHARKLMAYLFRVITGSISFTMPPSIRVLADHVLDDTEGVVRQTQRIVGARDSTAASGVIHTR